MAPRSRARAPQLLRRARQQAGYGNLPDTDREKLVLCPEAEKPESSKPDVGEVQEPGEDVDSDGNGTPSLPQPAALRHQPEVGAV